MLVKDLLNVAKGALEEKGIPEADSNSRLLMGYLLGVDQGKLFMNWGKELDDGQCERFFKLLDMRFARIPLQRIIGYQSFMGEEFKVADDVLIPRPETELLVEKAIDALKPLNKPVVLDLCTGSGIIGITIANNVSSAKVFASDISEKAIELAKENAKRLKAKIIIKQGDLFAPFLSGLIKTKFDMIISNPPYICSADIDTLQAEVRDYEPHLALDGGTDGLDFYRRIFDKAARCLTKNGVIFMEIGDRQGEALKELAEKAGEYKDIAIFKDYAGLDRIFYCKLK